MSDVEQHAEGDTIFVKYRQSQGGTIKTVSGDVIESYDTGDGWRMKLAPSRDLPTVRLDGDKRGAFVETRRQGRTWTRLGVAEAIHNPSDSDE